MCGIAGFTGDNNQATLRAMCNSLVHRGPDDEGFLEKADISLGMRRLAIVDIDGGQQPISNETDEIWVVFNGEIYNHAELRRLLLKSGHQFKTSHSDTEVIVHLYEEFGEDWPEYVNGMFGIALWDQRRKTLLLYRDRIGKKPLYFSTVRNNLVFASEIKAILRHPDACRDLDYEALYHYFSFKNISAPSTAYKKIKQLLPGHLLKWQQGQILSRPYWRLDFSNPLTDITEEEAAAHLLSLLKDAVSIRMQCDAPYGAYLSGGVDSSAVVALMSQMQDRPVKTFCLGYSDQAQGQFWGKHQDISYAREISRQLGTEHYEHIIDAREFAERMPEVIGAFDEPFSGTVSTYFLSILIHKHVKVALSGDGADELFGSYLAHRLAFPISRYLVLVAKGKTAWDTLSEEEKKSLAPFNNPQQFRFLQQIAVSEISVWRNALTVFNDPEKNQLLSPTFLQKAGYPSTKGRFVELASTLTAIDILNRSLEIDQKELLPNQVLPFVDKLSMAHSIEVRVPYLDYRIIEFANKLPGQFKIKDGVTKFIHKKALQGQVPYQLLTRKKEGFVQPIYQWMHGSLHKWTMGLLSCLPEEYFNRPILEQLCRNFQAGDTSTNNKIWNLACFSIWYNNHFLKKANHG